MKLVRCKLAKDVQNAHRAGLAITEALGFGKVVRAVDARRPSEDSLLDIEIPDDREGDARDWIEFDDTVLKYEVRPAV